MISNTDSTLLLYSTEHIRVKVYTGQAVEQTHYINGRAGREWQDWPQRALDQRYNAVLQTGRSPAAKYARHVETLGRTVQLKTGDDLVSGVAVRVEEDGALMLQTAAGERVIRFGDVVS